MFDKALNTPLIFAGRFFPLGYSLTKFQDQGKMYIEFVVLLLTRFIFIPL